MKLLWAVTTSLYHDLYAMSCCHDELVVECPEDQAEEVATFAGQVGVVGMDRVANQGLAANHHERLSVDAGIEILQSWGGG